MYKASKEGDWYVINKSSKPLLTPMGTPVKTHLEILADRLVKHLSEYGEDPSDPVSIVAFHYAMLDFFLNVSRTENERSIAIGLDEGNDWTFNCPAPDPNIMMRWWAVFGRPMSSKEREEAKKWLSSLTLMQLCAVCIIGRFTESVNIPYRLSTNVDRNDVKRYAKEIVVFYPFVSAKILYQAFENFIFYFTLEDQGPAKYIQQLKPDPVVVDHRPPLASEHIEKSSQPSIDRYFMIAAELYRACGPDSPEYAFALSKVAGLYLANGQYDKAESLYEQALILMEKACSPEHPDVAMILEGMALLYGKTGREVDAKRIDKRAAAIRAIKR